MKKSNKNILISAIAVGILAICFAASPMMIKQHAAGAAGPAPQPTPPDIQLDRDSAAEFLEFLTDSLSYEIEDQATLNAITSRWRTRNLVGRTMKQAVDILLADVKSIVRDPEITGYLEEEWNYMIENAEVTYEEYEDEETAPARTSDVSPSVVNRSAPAEGIRQVQNRSASLVPTAGALTDSRKASLGAVEMGFFRSATENDVYFKEAGYYEDQFYEIFKNNQDPELQMKIAAVHRAVKTIKDRGVNIPYGLRVYCTNHSVAQNRAFSRNERFEPIAYVTLRWAGPGGVSNSLSTQRFLDFDRPTISLIHEIGHILHERSLGDAFWTPGSIVTGSPTTANKVSGYAGNNKKEFVAEVFTGLILGKVWPTDVMNEYRRYGGPAVANMRR